MSYAGNLWKAACAVLFATSERVNGRVEPDAPSRGFFRAFYGHGDGQHMDDSSEAPQHAALVAIPSRHAP